ncbi:MAG: GTP-binding protein [Planctomycetaceae bacterium]
MVQINFAKGEVQCKVVYYGPSCSGKTANLRMIHEKAPAHVRGALTSIATDAERTLFFDFLPLDLGVVAGTKTRVHLYAVPWIERHNALRILVLEGVDAVVFVADSSRNRLADNIAAVENLRENLGHLGRGLDELPIVFQWNKSDAADAMPEDELERELNPGRHRSFPAVASQGTGVFATLKAITQAVLENVASTMRLPAAVAPAAVASATVAPAVSPAMAHAGASSARTIEAPAAVVEEEPVLAYAGVAQEGGVVSIAPIASPAGSRFDDFHSVEDLPAPASDSRVAEEPSAPPVQRPRWHTRAPLAPETPVEESVPAAETAKESPSKAVEAPRRAVRPPPPRIDPEPEPQDLGRRVLVGPPKQLHCPRPPLPPSEPAEEDGGWDAHIAGAPRRASRIPEERDAQPVTDRRRRGLRAHLARQQIPPASLVAGSTLAFVTVATIGYLVFVLL